MKIYNNTIKSLLEVFPKVDPEEDPLRYYKIPIIRTFYFERIRAVISCLNYAKSHKGCFNKILDIGYGSVILFPYLRDYYNEIYGIDKHGKSMEIEEIFEKFNIKINLFDGDILEINFEDEFFDCITCISVLDYVKEYDKAINEIYRVLKHSGILIVGLVVKNSITDLGFSILNAKTDIYHVATYKEIFK